MARFYFLTLSCLLFFVSLAQSQESESFKLKGYYLTFMRMPVMGLPEWKQTIDCIQQDGGNTLLLWMAGGFRSKRFPITWQYNHDHKNIEKDFAKELIDYAHQKDIQVLLGFTPFGYDGVNQYPIEHPELKARQQNGQPADKWGIHSWGYNLCPSKSKSQEFMLDYVREMFFEFYPNADGLLIESSDYSICYCPDCKEKFFDKEFQFVEQISKEVWARKPKAHIVVYPRYFSTREVPGFDVSGSKYTFDPRWTLFFTPHSAHIDPDLLKTAKSSIYSDDAPALKTPWKIREAAQKARQAGIIGYVPSLEGFSFQVQYPEGGEAHLIGRRLMPFGFDWLQNGQMPFGELLIRVNRIAYREFSKNPEMSEAAFKKVLGQEIFGSADLKIVVDDLLDLQEAVFFERSWWSASPLLTPSFLTQRADKEKWSGERLKQYARRLDRVREIANRYRISKTNAEQELHRIAEFVVQKWPPSEEGFLNPTAQ